MGYQIQHIERSIFELIRLRTVSLGLTPDVTLFPDTPQGLKQYQDALTQIQETKGIAFEIFGTEAPVYHGQEKFSRIVLNFNSLVPGEYGVEPGPHLKPQANDFVEVIEDNLVYNYLMDCILLSESQSALRIGLDIIYGSLPVMGYANFYPEVPDDFFVMRLDTTTRLPKEDTGYLGYQVTYEIPDVIISEERILSGAIKPIIEITVDMTLSQYLGIGSFKTEFLIS